MEKNIVALTENELENISGGSKEGSFHKAFNKAMGKFCASLVVTVPLLLITGLFVASVASVTPGQK